MYQITEFELLKEMRETENFQFTYEINYIVKKQHIFIKYNGVH